MEDSNIGSIDTVRGEVIVVTRADVEVTVTKGMPLYEGDTIKTGEQSTVKVVYIDGTVVVLSDNGQMVINEVSYDDQKFDININSGMFRFATGEIAKLDNDTILIRTPAVDIGVRGTTLLGTIGVNGETSTFTLVKDADGKVGTVIMSSEFGGMILNQAGQTFNILSYLGAIEEPYMMTPVAIERKYHNVLSTDSYKEESPLDNVLNDSSMFDIHPTYAIIPVSSPVDTTFNFIAKQTVSYKVESSRPPAPPVESEEPPAPPVESEEPPAPPVESEESKIFIERDISGTEDGFIGLTSLVNLGPSQSSIRIAGIPEGASFSHGTDNSNGSWSFTASELTDLSIILPEDSDETFILRVDKTVTSADVNAARTIVDAGIVFEVTQERVDTANAILALSDWWNDDALPDLKWPYEVILRDLHLDLAFIKDRMSRNIRSNLEGNTSEVVRIIAAGGVIEGVSQADVNDAQAILDGGLIDGVNITVSIEAIADKPIISNYLFNGFTGEPTVLDLGILSGDIDDSETLSIKLTNFKHKGVTSLDIEAAQGIIDDVQLLSETITEREVFALEDSYGVTLYQVGNSEGTLLASPDVLEGKFLNAALDVVKSNLPDIVTVFDKEFHMTVEQANHLIKIDELNQVISEITVSQAELDAAKAIVDAGLSEIIVSIQTNPDDEPIDYSVVQSSVIELSHTDVITATSEIDFSFNAFVTSTEYSNGDTTDIADAIFYNVEDVSTGFGLDFELFNFTSES